MSVICQSLSSQTIPNFGVDLNFWQLFSTFGNFWQLLATFGNFWQLLATFAYFWLLLATFGNFWLLLATFGTRVVLGWYQGGTFWYFLVLFGTFSEIGCFRNRVFWKEDVSEIGLKETGRAVPAAQSLKLKAQRLKVKGNRSGSTSCSKLKG